jgi:LmbE family N-acetylglucosaminyl deacetylase
MKILILSPHPDDGEMGAGGTIAKMAEEGNEIYYVIFSYHGQDFDKDEKEKAAEMIGIKKDKLIVLDYSVRIFHAYRQEILEDMIKLRKDISPDMVFIPASTDSHQDHQIINQEAKRAFRNYTLLGYEENWNNFAFSYKCFVPLTEGQVKKKLRAAETYASQKKLNKIYVDPDLIRCRLRDRGTYIRTKYAETFEIIRWVI